jgi:hypothetical protein
VFTARLFFEDTLSKKKDVFVVMSRLSNPIEKLLH